MPIRILHIIPTLVQGGAEKQLAMLASGLPRDRYDVRVCALTSSGTYQPFLESMKIPVQTIGKSRKFDPIAYFHLRQHVQELRPEIVHTWIFAANCYGRQAALSCGVKIIVAGERCVDRWKTRWQLAIDRYFAHRTSAIVVPSTGVRDFYVHQKLPANKFHVIPNGISTKDSGSISGRDELLDEFGLPHNSRLIGIVGRLWPQKRIKDAIWAGELISAVRDDTHLLIIGDGPQRWRLERFCEQVHVSNRIHFLGHRSDVLRLLPHFDCLWLTSEYEGMPNSIMEAMAAAVPVVATNIPGNRDLVIATETGHLVPVGDRAGFARVTHQLLDDNVRREKLGAAGRRRVIEHFSDEQMIQRYDSFYQTLIQDL